MRILLLDIENAPHSAHVWALFDQNVGLSQLRSPGYVLCWSAKWLGEKETAFASKLREPKRMLKRVHKLLDEADVVVHYNGRRHDIPHLNREFLLAGLTPPSPYKQVDLYHTVRRQFKFASNKLDHVCQQLGIGGKLKHVGHELWVDCMHGDPGAWAEMEKYNRHDVVLLERLYQQLLPWIPNHPNHAAYDEPGIPVCPSCGHHHLQRRGFSRTVANRYARYQCLGCGTWTREPFTETTRAERGVRMRALTC